MKLYQLFILISCFIAISALGQKNDAFEEEHWKKITKDLKYEKEADKETVEKSEEKQTEQRQEDYTSNYRSGANATNFGELKYLFMGIVGVLLLLLIIYMVVNSKTNPSLSAQSIELKKIENIEEHIHEVDLDQLVDEYVSDNQYDVAIRLSFLTIIKELSNKKMIKWERQKTNWEFHNELKPKDLRPAFSQMINHFENVWYGEHHLNETQFNEVTGAFNAFKETLNISED